MPKQDKSIKLDRKQYKEMQDRIEELETQLMIEREELRKTKNHLMTIIGSKSFRTGKIIFHLPGKTKQYLKNRKSSLKKSLKGVYQLNSKGNIKVGIITRDGTLRPTSSAFLRLFSPLTYGETAKELAINLIPDNAKTIPKDIDICIVQRTALNNVGVAKMLVKDLKAKNIPLIVDTDDNFAELDHFHPQYHVQRELVDALNYIKLESDRIWVSTERLAKEYKDKRVVHRNSVDDRLWELKEYPILQGKKIKAVYMGTGTHDDDFAMILPALDKINEKYNDAIQLTVLGVASKLSPRSWLNFKPTNMMYPYFVKWFSKQGPFDIGLAPLVSSDFNKAKSDIKALDYLCTGVLPVVSDLDPYKDKDLDDLVLRVGYGEDDWYHAFENIILNKEKYANQKLENTKKIEKYIHEERSVKVISGNILSEINELLKK